MSSGATTTQQELDALRAAQAARLADEQDDVRTDVRLLHFDRSYQEQVDAYRRMWTALAVTGALLLACAVGAFFLDGLTFLWTALASVVFVVGGATAAAQFKAIRDRDPADFAKVNPGKLDAVKAVSSPGGAGGALPESKGEDVDKEEDDGDGRKCSGAACCSGATTWSPTAGKCVGSETTQITGSRVPGLPNIASFTSGKRPTLVQPRPATTSPLVATPAVEPLRDASSFSLRGLASDALDAVRYLGDVVAAPPRFQNRRKIRTSW